MPDVVSFGSVNIDLVARLDQTTVKSLAARYEWFPVPDETAVVESVPTEVDEFVDRTMIGGKGSNQSVAAAQAGAATGFCGRVGSDESEYGVRSTLADRGVDVSHVESADAETGKAYVFVDQAGENRIAIITGANGAVSNAYADRHLEGILDAECLLLQNEIPMSTMRSLVDALKNEPDRPIVIYDPAPPVGAEPLLQHDAVDIITPNAYEYELLRDVIAEFEGTVIRKRGADPVIIQQPDREPINVTPPDIDPIDTTGAGDVFNGYLAAQLAVGEPLVGAVTAAITAASLATTEAGAQRAIPSMDAVDGLME